MEITACGDTPSTSGMSGSNVDILNNASLSTLAVVNLSAAKPVINQVSAIDRQALGKAAFAVAPTVDWLAEQGESVNTTHKKLVEESCSYVSANPLKALWFDVIEGFLLSRIILR